MVESAPRSEPLRTGETTRNANTAECLVYKDGCDGRCRQEDERAGVTFWDGGSPKRRVSYDLSKPQVVEVQGKAQAIGLDTVAGVKIRCRAGFHGCEGMSRLAPTCILKPCSPCSALDFAELAVEQVLAQGYTGVERQIIDSAGTSAASRNA